MQIYLNIFFTFFFQVPVVELQQQLFHTAVLCSLMEVNKDTNPSKNVRMDRNKISFVSNVLSYPDKVSQRESVLLLYDGASVMDSVQQGTHQFTCE